MGRFTDRTGLIAALALLLIAAVPPEVRSQAFIEIDPGLTQVESPGHGRTFAAEIDLEDVRDLHAYSVEIFYNPAVVTHTGIEEGPLFDGYDSLFLTSGSDTSQGRILVDHAVLGTHTVSDSAGTAFRVTFEVTGAGHTNLFVADTELRNLANQSLDHTVDSTAVVAVGKVPSAAHTERFTSERPGRTWRSFGQTGVQVQFDGEFAEGSVTAARFDQRPGDSSEVSIEASKDTWEDAQVPDRYWTITSSAPGTGYRLSFSYADIDGVEEPAALRVARRPLEGSDERAWQVVPAAHTRVDENRQAVTVHSSSSGKTADGLSDSMSGQYVIASSGARNPLPTSEERGIPSGYRLAENYPNPFNPHTTIRYGLPRMAEVRIAVFDRLGREVAVLVNGRRRAGYHEVTFDGSGLSSGLYFYRLETASTIKTRKMLLAK